MAIKLAILEDPVARDYSIADAKDHLPEAVRAAEQGDTVTLTRRGKPVAVLLSIDRFRGLERSRPDFWELARDLRERAASEGAIFEKDDFEGLRDRSPARDVDL
jgi:prevent-host-death family protein